MKWQSDRNRGPRKIAKLDDVEGEARMTVGCRKAFGQEEEQQCD